MFKIISLLIMLSITTYTSENTKVFSNLSTPLFSAIEPTQTLLKNVSKIKNAQIYISDAKELLEYSKSISIKSEKKLISEYLKRLRALGDEYELLVSEINKEIESSIDNNKPKEFIYLTSYKYDGLLKNYGLYEKAVNYYMNNSFESRSKFLDSKIKINKNIKQTRSELEVASKKMTADLNQKQQEREKNDVGLQLLREKEYIKMIAWNKKTYNITMSIESNFTNLKPTKNIPKAVVLKPNEVLEVTKLYLSDKKPSLSIGYRYIMGDYNAVHDDSYLYRLPYENGTSQMVTQGYNGEATHKGPSRYSIDFGMEEGTKILAARDGTVVKIKEDSNTVGYSEEFAQYGNYVTIQHDDNTFATYYHLKRNGAMVEVGDKVKAGSFIAYSGNTGYSSGPHLHFSVFSVASDYISMKTIPVKFITANAVVANLKRGSVYKAK